MLGDHHRHAERDLRAPLIAVLVVGVAILERGDGLLEHRLVELEADFLDVARLFLAEQVACPADVEVVARELETGAKAFERLQHVEPALGGVGELALRRHGEQRVGALLGAADAAADLVELREAEMVGVVHDQRVGVGDIEAGFDDGRRQQHVELAVVEIVHDVVELARRHLAIGDDEADLRARARAGTRRYRADP